MTPEQLWDSLPAVLAQQDEPVHSMTALVGYHLMALAARHGVKVILNGQGADELIGGYGSYFHDRWAELVRGGAWPSAWREIVAYGAAHGGSSRSRFAATLRRVGQRALAGHGSYRRASSARRLGRARAHGWLSPDLSQHLNLQHAAHNDDVSVRTSLAHSIARSPLPLYLRVEDRNSMAHSIEVRLPFLDHRLVSLVMAMDSSWKLRGPWNKFVLREAMRGRIPESVRTRVDKMGFPTDADAWFRSSLASRLESVLLDPSVAADGILDARAMADGLQAFRQGRGSISSDQLFAAAQFQVWRQAMR
jgi:asparagine synthase (glutamine-hydrolysing)